MQPKPKFEPGDYVVIHAPGDVDNGKILQIEKSPRPRRSGALKGVSSGAIP